MSAITEKFEKTLNQYCLDRDSNSLKKLRKILKKVEGDEESIIKNLDSYPWMIKMFPKNKRVKVALCLIKKLGIKESTVQVLWHLKEKDRCKVLEECLPSDLRIFCKISSNYGRYEADAWME